jgi:DNA-binding transcriptional LysR family regulator
MLASLVKACPWLMAVLAGSLQIHAIDGTTLRPLEPAGIANVLLFVATDCPISNSYAPEIQRICRAYASSGISCALIYEDAGVTASVVRKHLDDYRYRGIPAAIDRDGALALQVRASVTPEAVVIDRHGTIRYRGRIDNFYAALGRPRQTVTAHDLQDALAAIAAGRPVASSETEAVGCYIVSSELRRK